MGRKRLVLLVLAVVAVSAGLFGAGYLLARSAGDAAPAAAPPPSTSAAPNGAGGAELRGLLGKGRGETYHARYQATSADPGAAGQDLVLELWQRGTDRRQDLQITANGTKAHSAGFLLPSGAVSCTSSADTPWTCKKVTANQTTDPMLDQLAEQFSGKAGAGRDDTIAALKVRCFPIPTGTTTGEICLTDHGIPARVLAGPSRFELTTLNTDIADTTFQPPAQPA
jgi:hypothetical protein